MTDTGRGRITQMSASSPANVMSPPRVLQLQPPHSPSPNAVIPEGPVTGRLRRRERYEVLALVVADFLAVGSALLLSLEWLGETGLFGLAALLVVLTPLLSKGIGLYDRDRHLLVKTTLDEVPKVFHVATFCTFVFWLLDAALPSPSMQPSEVLITWIGLFALMITARACARMVTRQRLAPERCLLVGPSSTADYLATKLSDFHWADAKIVGRVPFGEVGDSGRVPVLGDLGTLGLVLAEHDIDRVILVPTAHDFELALDTTRLVKSLGVRVSLLPRLFEVVGSSVEFDNLSGVTLLGLREYGLSPSSYALKRAMDIVGATVGLVLLAPFFLVTALAIKLTSPGPVLFRQARIGRHGRCFGMLKFRTMVEDAPSKQQELLALNETHGIFKVAHDPRVTRVGRMLRKISLDELPQLFNVIAGDMSLVGPRPLVPEEDCKVEGWQRRRLQVPPGMTGHWQILRSTRVPLHEMAKIDYLYGANWSLWGDIKTLVRTIPHVVRREGM
jgi:exopolysaccharide biosynthesis polyprenyl glycosylphosphotransferase